MKNESQKRGLGGKQKEEEKASKETKVYKEKQEQNIPLSKNSHYDRKHFGIFVCSCT